MTIGERIREARLKAGFTQRMLADELGISFINVSQWENGARNPKIETLQKIAEVLGVQPWELMGYDDSIRVGVGRFSNKQLKKLVEELNSGSKSMLETVPKEYILLRFFYCLNETGQKKAVENVEDLAKIPEYQKKDEPSKE